ncbi:MAG: S-methyl-5-thioribose-1-phosphate isomerase [Bacteriovoracaceae bacterium]|jgi:methylthioribose-1-phosphate isomerase|nr:S-methyl-5-thioribose-1-phosphate isomerase [Halobacteriovoraceae bacterium]MDP7321380.1 S-methyl-5-thioribose-1-phosphate isomerase [Bacteriovoracaceae bacterium]
MQEEYTPIQFQNGFLKLLDQRLLPHKEEFVLCETIEQGHMAIKDMVVRGAPCIGFTAIFSLALWLKSKKDFSQTELLQAANFLRTARPTAVNLNFEIDKVISLVSQVKNNEEDLYLKIVEYGLTQIRESENKNRKMAIAAQKDLVEREGKKKFRILTHCNTGFLACGSLGTALGVVEHLHENNLIKDVWVDETRPYLQGARLTSYELMKLGIEHRIVVEGAASYLMREGLVDAIFTGADRIVKNGDTANKIGTSNLAILANHYNIPFYIVAPTSSFDLNIETGNDIEIELRDEEEVLSYGGTRIAPRESRAFNPSFDITEGKLITGIISEKGIAKGNYLKTLQEIV